MILFHPSPSSSSLACGLHGGTLLVVTLTGGKPSQLSRELQAPVSLSAEDQKIRLMLCLQQVQLNVVRGSLQVTRVRLLGRVLELELMKSR